MSSHDEMVCVHTMKSSPRENSLTSLVLNSTCVVVTRAPHIRFIRSQHYPTKGDWIHRSTYVGLDPTACQKLIITSMALSTSMDPSLNISKPLQCALTNSNTFYKFYLLSQDYFTSLYIKSCKLLGRQVQVVAFRRFLLILLKEIFEDFFF